MKAVNIHKGLPLEEYRKKHGKIAYSNDHCHVTSTNDVIEQRLEARVEYAKSQLEEYKSAKAARVKLLQFGMSEFDVSDDCEDFYKDEKSPEYFGFKNPEYFGFMGTINELFKKFPKPSSYGQFADLTHYRSGDGIHQDRVVKLTDTDVVILTLSFEDEVKISDRFEEVGLEFDAQDVIATLYHYYSVISRFIEEPFNDFFHRIMIKEV